MKLAKLVERWSRSELVRRSASGVATIVALVVGASAGMVLAIATAGPAPGSADMSELFGDDVTVIELDVAGMSEEELRSTLAAAAVDAPDRDIVVVPVGAPEPISREEEARRDEERSRKELADRSAAEAEMRAAGLIVDTPPPPCASAPTDLSGGVAARFVFCEWRLVALPSQVDPGADLSSYVGELAGGSEAADVAQGFWSAMREPVPISAVVIDEDGAVEIDFDGDLRDQMEPSPTGSMVDSFLRQIYATVFQFEVASSVTLTIEGSCTEMGDLLMTGCVAMDRDLWELMMPNWRSEYPSSITLGGGR